MDTYRQVIEATAQDLPNSFSEDFKAELRSLSHDQFVDLFDAITRANDTVKTLDHYRANPEMYRIPCKHTNGEHLDTCSHNVNRGAW